MKPGYKTTEFWLGLSAAICCAAMGFMKDIDAPWAITSVSIISIVYTILRSSLKNKTP